MNGFPKTDATEVNATGSFPIRNGQTTGSFTVTPLTTLKGTVNQEADPLGVLGLDSLQHARPFHAPHWITQ